ncbi:MAG: ABC transporter permease [Candidatus Heimdallarchaeota archaeon]|nr:ABC transporter permease [Candidatus Heimdallarchaeota archaeon]
MGLRLIGKSIKLAMRSRMRFIIFTLMYTVLMLWNAWNLQSFTHPSGGTGDLLLLAISIGSTVVLAVLYAWIVINYRKREIATLKCIGYTNGNIRTLIVGELVWVTTMSFVIVAELLIHITGFTAFINLTTGEQTIPILRLLPIVISFAMFLLSQIVGILLMYSKILKLRPIVALRVLK